MRFKCDGDGVYVDGDSWMPVFGLSFYNKMPEVKDSLLEYYREYPIISDVVGDVVGMMCDMGVWD